jgi:hypothetical protein
VRFAVDTVGEEESAGAPVVAPRPEAEGPKTARCVAGANVNRDRPQEHPGSGIEGVDLAGGEAEMPTSRSFAVLVRRKIPPFTPATRGAGGSQSESLPVLNMGTETETGSHSAIARI